MDFQLIPSNFRERQVIRTAFLDRAGMTTSISPSAHLIGHVCRHLCEMGVHALAARSSTRGRGRCWRIFLSQRTAYTDRGILDKTYVGSLHARLGSSKSRMRGAPPTMVRLLLDVGRYYFGSEENRDASEEINAKLVPPL